MPRDRILVTGASGFIGREVVAKLTEHGFRLNLVLRDARGLPQRGKTDTVNILATGDLASTDFASNLRPAFAGVQAVIHLAGLAHIATADQADADADADRQFIRANAEATRNLAQMALSHGVQSFIHLSSLAAITTNTSDVTIDDNTAIQPTTGYGRSKRMAELEVKKLADARIFAVSLRAPLVVGAGARGNWAAFQKLARTGLPLPFAALHNKRSFVSVETLTNAIVALITNNPLASQSGDYCIADPEPLSVAQVISTLRKGMKIPPRLFYCPPVAFTLLGALTGRRRQLAGLIGPLEVDPTRFYRTFSFKPMLQLDEAIRHSGAAYVGQTIQGTDQELS